MGRERGEERSVIANSEIRKKMCVGALREKEDRSERV